MATTSKTPARKKTKTTRKVSATAARKTTTKKTAATKKTNASRAAKTTKKSTTEKSAVATATPVVKKTQNAAMQQLRTLNLFVAFAAAAQAGLILWLSRAFAGIRSVSLSFPTSDSLATAATGQTQTVTAVHNLVDLHLSWLIVAYLGVMGVMHLSLATVLRNRYEGEIARNLNRVRWATFATSGSILLVTIAMTAGISDLVTLLAIIGFNTIAALTALSREHYTQNKERSRLVYGVGALAAAAPWLFFVLNIFGTHQYGSDGTPKYMYWIFLTGAVLVAALAKNLREQTRARGRWIDYVYAEKVYVWLSLIGSSAVAWQIYSALLKK